VSASRKEASTTVARCVPRHDGQWLIITRDGRNAVAFSELPEGARVVVRAGIAERTAHG
jgi:hypothetical protein